MHSMWKSRIEKCIDTGTFDVPVDVIEMDDECYFGKWLYGDDLEPAVRVSAEFKRVKECHAKFHRVAAKVVALSLAGKKQEASDLMAWEGEYTKVTTELIKELTSWAEHVD
jgi:hypothetical protein